jgi:serine protease Do
VVQNAGKVTVILQDGTKHPAKVVGRDGKTDLALLKIEAKEPLPYVQWGDSNALQVGDWVLAVGNPFGLGGTVSSGIISARGRDIHSGPYDDFLQIDAAINRGNSGGPTFNLNGQVIGINTAIYSPNGGSVGIGFAIPASLAKPVIEQLKEHGKVERGWLGVQVQEVTPEIAKSLGLPKTEGALVAQVTKNTPAEEAGLRQGDVILGYNGHDIAKLRDLPIAVAETPVGQKAELKVWRDGHDETLEPVIAQMPSDLRTAENTESTGAEKAMGVSLAPLTRQARERLHLAGDVKGVVVMAVAPDSPLAELGLERGDVIEDINQHPVATPEEAAKELAQVQHEQGNEKQIMLLVNRHGINQYVAMTMKRGTDGGNG